MAELKKGDKVTVTRAYGSDGHDLHDQKVTVKSVTRDGVHVSTPMGSRFLKHGEYRR